MSTSKPPVVLHTREQWAEYERFGRLLQDAPWRFATTMAENPHHYTLRKAWASDEDFVWAVEYLRREGYGARYQGRTYIQIDVNEHFYWTMGAAINRPDGSPHTILINRKRLQDPACYDPIAARYDELFRDEDARQEEAALMDFLGGLGLGPLHTLEVLDVGCGTGLLLRHLRPRRYLGVDPSAEMLVELRHRHPDAAVIAAPLARFVPPRGAERADLLLALFGVGSYLSDAELSRIPFLLHPGGKAVVMFYREGYEPETYRRTRTVCPHRPWRAGLLAGAAVEMGDYVTVVVEAPVP